MKEALAKISLNDTILEISLKTNFDTTEDPRTFFVKTDVRQDQSHLMAHIETSAFYLKAEIFTKDVFASLISDSNRIRKKYVATNTLPVYLSKQNYGAVLSGIPAAEELNLVFCVNAFWNAQLDKNLVEAFETIRGEICDSIMQNVLWINLGTLSNIKQPDMLALIDAVLESLFIDVKENNGKASKIPPPVIPPPPQPPKRSAGVDSNGGGPNR